MKIRFAFLTALLAAYSFPSVRECFAQTRSTTDGADGSKAAKRAEFQRRVSENVRRLKAERPNRYVENADLAVDPQAYVGKRVVLIGLGGFSPKMNAKSMMRLADPSGGIPGITVDFARLSEQMKKNLLKIELPPHALLVSGVWRDDAEGYRLIADEIRDLGDTLNTSLAYVLNESDASAVRAGQAGRLRQVSEELQRLKTETPRRYAENADLNAKPHVYADKRVVAVGFGGFSANEKGVFTVRLADSYGGFPAIIADFSGVSKETKKTLLKSNFPPHVLLIAGAWRKTAEGWRLFADEARDFGEANCGPALLDCLKSPE
ncbi:MAG: hypothetical protein HYV14_13160 [Elusimicrobia bacterium]|nr:hypothetical protein [Elusimicrobiota bacterium]